MLFAKIDTFRTLKKSRESAGLRGLNFLVIHTCINSCEIQPCMVLRRRLLRLVRNEFHPNLMFDGRLNGYRFLTRESCCPGRWADRELCPLGKLAAILLIRCCTCLKLKLISSRVSIANNVEIPSFDIRSDDVKSRSTLTNYRIAFFYEPASMLCWIESDWWSERTNYSTLISVSFVRILSDLQYPGVSALRVWVRVNINVIRNKFPQILFARP